MRRKITGCRKKCSEESGALKALSLPTGAHQLTESRDSKTAPTLKCRLRVRSTPKKSLPQLRAANLTRLFLTKELTMLLISSLNQSRLSKRNIHSTLTSTTRLLKKLQKAQCNSLKMRILFFLLKRVKRLQLSARWLNLRVSRAQAHPLSILQSFQMRLTSLRLSA